MRQHLTVLAVSAAVLAASALHAEEPAGTVARVEYFKPKPGMTAQFEAARKEHNAWHREHADRWAWVTWEIATGKRAGQYVTGTFDHRWADLDAREPFDAEDTANALSTMGPSLEGSEARIYTVIPQASHGEAESEPAPLAQVTYYHVNPAGVSEFGAAIRSLKEAADKANWPVSFTWYHLVSGATGPQFVLVYNHKSWADFGGSGESVEAAISSVVGPYEAVRLLQGVRANTLSTYSELLRYRRDLSYLPAKPQ
jgi:hypothetical protein